MAQARLELAEATKAGAGTQDAADRFRPARQVLIRRGADALDVDPASLPGLAEMIAQLAAAAAGPGRRVCAILILDALAMPGLLTVRSSQPRLDRDIRRLVESALPDVLRRAGYPFTAEADTRRRSLISLATSLDEYLQPPEPTFPPWLSGLSRD
jgi:hypothetical protein